MTRWMTPATGPPKVSRTRVSVISPGRNIVLIGLMGVGKTTVGRVVAGALDRPFVDTDEEVERVEGRTIRDLFAVEGERAFRALESAAVRQVSAIRGQVIAVGGGAVLDPANITNLRGNGDLVWLDAPLAAMVAHLRGDAEVGRRPLLADSSDLEATLQQMYTHRHDAYTRAASHVLYTQGRPVVVVAEELLEWAKSRPGLLTREERG